MMINTAITTILLLIQAVLIALFFAGATYDTEAYSHQEYVIFRDIMVMLLLGFGYLMAFLRKDGLGAVGLTMMLTVIAIQLNIFMEEFCRFIYGDAEFPIHLSVFSFIDGEFSAATLLISFGAVIGRASPVQLIVMAICQSFFYALNKVVIVFGLLEVEDVGGTMTIHMFGAYFGLAVSRALRPPDQASSSNADPNAISDVLAMIGSTLLWVYWPSFVGATETATPENENLCIIHTILALLGSTIATFFLSQLLTMGKFHPVHIANSTLAGGVAVGASARLAMTPGGAFLLGIVAGAISVLGYTYLSPALEDKLSLYDTCGVGNLHGLPSIVGGFASAIFVALDSKSDFLLHEGSAQAGFQVAAVFCTLTIAIISGVLTGIAMRFTGPIITEEFNDNMWWEGEYFETVFNREDDGSSKRKVSPVSNEIQV